ncbi:MAG: hypothetical protein IPH42_02055 [Bacteroidetes bacterium]|nr:hypothetical protein [Bacteroidota bacterium]
MKKITQLIQTFSPNEINSLRKYYAINSRQDSILRNKLFEIVVENNPKSDKEAAEKLGTKTGAAFSMLKKRFYQDALKILFWGEGSKRFKSKFYESRYRVRMMIMEADILLDRQLITSAREVLVKAERIADKYELTEELLLLKDLKQTRRGLSRTLPKYHQLTKDKITHINDIKDKILAFDYHRQITMPNIYNANKDLTYIEKSKEANILLKELVDRNPNANILSSYLKSQIVYYHLTSDYMECLNVALPYAELIRTSPAVHSKDAMGSAGLYLSNINLQIYNFSESIKYANDYMHYFYNGSPNQEALHENLFVCYLMLKDYSNAYKQIEIVSKFKIVKPGNLIFSRWVFYRANLDFAQKNFNEALELLQKQTMLTKDKSGYWVGYKILEMLCIIELKNYDWLEYRTETFRKLLSKVKTKNVARPKIILHLLKALIKENYNFETVTKKIKWKLDYYLMQLAITVGILMVTKSSVSTHGGWKN